jgi:multicomponent Na+:H+ antiporter subunit G
VTVDLELALLAAGLAVTVISSVAALTAARAMTRLHFLTPITSVGFPLIGLAISVANGLGLTTAEVLFIVFLVAVSGPVLETAIGRVIAQREGMMADEAPE